MPVYNAEEHLLVAINSILEQNFKNFEFIIINDGSTDNSQEIINNVALMDKRIVVLNQKNKGIVASLNAGILLAKGEFIARMDADDISRKNRLEKQLALMLRLDADICGCAYTIVDDASMKIRPIKVAATNNQIIVALTVGVPFAHPTIMMRKSFLDKFNLSYRLAFKAEDYCLWMEMYRCGARFANSEEDLFLYRISNASLSKKNRKDIRPESDKYIKDFVFQYKLDIENAYKCLMTESMSTDMQRLLAKSIILFFIHTKNIRYFWLFN